ncbi:MAG: 4a-hydroxytetrahydrobiopterin dehydratase [Pseudomonadota bacterium]
MSYSKEALREKRCTPCEGGIDPLDEATILRLIESLDTQWTVVDDNRVLCRSIEFAGFNRVMSFVNAVAWIANTEGHHPVIELRYGAVTIRWTTHAIDGLSVNDFICAAKTDQLLESV